VAKGKSKSAAAPGAPKKPKKTASGLFENETVSFGADEKEPKASDEELNNRYAKGDVRIVTESARYSLAGILAMLQEKVVVESNDPDSKELRYKLDPEYQRRHRWSNQRKSRLIESFLMNVPVPPVFLYERDLARFEVMDGRQRLTALSEFYDNKFALEGLEYWADLDGRRYSELPSKVRDGIDRRYISSIILLKETAANEEQAAMLKKIVFERLNSGGVELSSQETRNAVYNGPLNQLCLKLSEYDPFRRLWGIPLVSEEDKQPKDSDASVDEVVDDSTNAGRRMFEKMEDVELVLRFFAYRQITQFKAGLNKISEFLDKYIVKGNKFSPAILEAFSEMFTSTVDFLNATLGLEAFSVIGVQQRPTKIVYDPIMYIASSDDVMNAKAALVAHKDILREELRKMYVEHQALFAGRRTNFADTQQRNACVKAAFAAAIAKV
jgi:hypothetical protein